MIQSVEAGTEVSLESKLITNTKKHSPLPFDSISNPLVLFLQGEGVCKCQRTEKACRQQSCRW